MFEIPPAPTISATSSHSVLFVYVSWCSSSSSSLLKTDYPEVLIVASKMNPQPSQKHVCKEQSAHVTIVTGRDMGVNQNFLPPVFLQLRGESSGSCHCEE